MMNCVTCGTPIVGADSRTKYCVTCKAEKVKEWSRTGHKRRMDTVPGAHERWLAVRVAWRYSISPELAMSMARADCEICGLPAAQNKHGKNCIDHDHVTGVVRGTLCSMCNQGIGFLKDSQAVLLKAVEYLKTHPCE